MEQQHFLLISKDMALYGAIAAAFADEGWLLHQTTTAVEGVAKIQKHSYSGILWDFAATPLDTILATLDVMRQMMNGPIIIMGEAYKPKVRRKLFRFHADDCLPRSLNDAELLVPLIRQRLWVYSQLNSEESSNNKPRRPHRDNVTIGNLRLDFDHRCVYVNDQKVILTPKEFKLLKYLYDNRNQVISTAISRQTFQHHGSSGCSFIFPIIFLLKISSSCQPIVSIRYRLLLSQTN